MRGDTKFFFIDEQGTFNARNMDWLLRGGVALSVSEYMHLSRKLQDLHHDYFGEISEVRWSDVSRAMYAKRESKSLKNVPPIYENLTYVELEEFVKSFFLEMQKYDPTVIAVISQRASLEEKMPRLSRESSFLKMQLQNLMQRAQFLGSEEECYVIMIHDNEKNHLDDKSKKETYARLLKEDPYINSYTNIVDSLFIDFSHMNTGIQMADFVVGCLSGVLRGYGFSKQLYRQYLKQLVRSRGEETTRIGYGILPLPTTSESMTTYLKESFD